jgi:hypothetical protein
MMMKKTIGTIAVLALGVALIPSAARAACAAGVTFGQISSGHPQCGPSGYCYVTSGGVRTNASIEGNYWILGAGNTTIGVGIDNGNQGDLDWLPDLGFGGGVGLNGNWQAGGAGSPDGCPDTLGAGTSMVVALADISSGTPATGFFGVACALRNGGAATEYDYNTIVPLTNIDLKPIPKAAIVNSVRVDQTAVVTIGAPNFSSIFYTDGSPACNLNNVIKQYDVWVQQTARGGAAPTDRNTSGGWILGNTCLAGQNCPVTVACTGGGDCDAFFAISPKLDSGFGSSRVSPNSTRTQAGQNLATPPKPKTIKKMESGAVR